MIKNPINKSILIFLNIVLVLTAVHFLWSHSANLQKEQTKAELDRRVKANRMKRGNIFLFFSHTNSKTE